MAETTAAASALRAVLDPPPPPSDAHLAAAVGALSALRALLDARRSVSSRVSQLGAAVDAATRDTARRVEGVDGRVVEVKLASVLAMEERDRVAHELAALERQLAAVEGGQAGGAGGEGGKKDRRRRWSSLGELPVRLGGGAGGGGRTAVNGPCVMWVVGVSFFGQMMADRVGGHGGGAPGCWSRLNVSLSGVRHPDCGPLLTIIFWTRCALRTFLSFLALSLFASPLLCT